jgi:hypothetical protein
MDRQGDTEDVHLGLENYLNNYYIRVIQKVSSKKKVQAKLRVNREFYQWRSRKQFCMSL